MLLFALTVSTCFPAPTPVEQRRGIMISSINTDVLVSIADSWDRDTRSSINLGVA